MKKLIKAPFSSKQISDINNLASMAEDIAKNVETQNEDLFDLIDAHFEIETSEKYKKRFIAKARNQELLNRMRDILGR